VDNQDQHSANDASGAPANPGRRRFGSAGAKASGVILTLTSAPGMAEVMCRSPSGSLSGNLKSSPGNQTIVCGGLSPGYWKNWPDQWPPSVYPTTTTRHAATTFASVFPFGSTNLYRTGTMMEVLNNNDSTADPYNLGFHLVAAYLNVKSGKINYITVDRLKLMWHDLCTYGYYKPSATVKWYAEDIKIYLASTEH
jgi:hypothetical protein